MPLAHAEEDRQSFPAEEDSFASSLAHRTWQATPATEDVLYESSVLHRYADIDLGRAPASDETTILNFRHLLEEHDICVQMLDTVNLYLASRGIRITTGTVVDATIIHAPNSTKNKKKERDPGMHQTLCD